MAYEWKQITQTGDQPSPRSGHSFNWVGAQNYLLYGGIEERKDGKVIPDPEIYMLKLMQEKCTWYKEATNSTEKPLARSQHVAQTTPKGDRLFVFGGHHTQNTRLNDTWIFMIKELEWRRIGGKPAMNNQESDIGAPCPRANMGSCVFNGKVIIFGGHGGINFERKNFNDMHMFDFETETWSKVNAVNAGPEGRAVAVFLLALRNQVTRSSSMVAGTLRSNSMRSGHLTSPRWNGPTVISSMEFPDGIIARFSLRLFQLGNSSFSEVSVRSTTKVLIDHSASTLTPVASLISE